MRFFCGGVQDKIGDVHARIIGPEFARVNGPDENPHGVVMAQDKPMYRGKATVPWPRILKRAEQEGLDVGDAVVRNHLAWLSISDPRIDQTGLQKELQATHDELHAAGRCDGSCGY